MIIGAMSLLITFCPFHLSILKAVFWYRSSELCLSVFRWLLTSSGEGDLDEELLAPVPILRQFMEPEKSVVVKNQTR